MSDVKRDQGAPVVAVTAEGNQSREARLYDAWMAALQALGKINSIVKNPIEVEHEDVVNAVERLAALNGEMLAALVRAERMAINDLDDAEIYATIRAALDKARGQ